MKIAYIGACIYASALAIAHPISDLHENIDIRSDRHPSLVKRGVLKDMLKGAAVGATAGVAWGLVSGLMNRKKDPKEEEQKRRNKESYYAQQGEPGDPNYVPRSSQVWGEDRHWAEGSKYYEPEAYEQNKKAKKNKKHHEQPAETQTEQPTEHQPRHVVGCQVPKETQDNLVRMCGPQCRFDDQTCRLVRGGETA